jgi:opacity protein-like surface antigen
MNMNLIRLLGLTTAMCGLLLVLPVANAGIGAGNWEVGFGLGTTEFDSEVTDDSGYYLDVRGGYFFTDRFQLEGQLSDASTDEDFVDISVTSLFANAVFNFRPGAEIVPYALVGAGSTTLEVEAFGTEDDESPSYQAAVGSRFFVGARKKMAIRVELNAISEDNFDERSTHFSLAVGLSWRIGADR